VVITAKKALAVPHKFISAGNGYAIMAYISKHKWRIINIH
jgi:hypothetical protein